MIRHPKTFLIIASLTAPIEARILAQTIAVPDLRAGF